MAYKKGDTVQVWDWSATSSDEADQGHALLKRADTILGHGAIGVVVRHSRSSDNHNGYKLGNYKTCYLVALPYHGLVHVNKEWLRLPNEQSGLSA